MPDTPGANRAPEHSAYLDTPRGIFSAGGHWFRTTEALLQEYAGPVFGKVPLSYLIQSADRWLDAPRTFALWVLPVQLLAATPPASAIAAVLIYAAGFMLGPAMVSRWGASLLGWLEKPGLQVALYTGAMSWLSVEDQFGAVAVGLVGFVLLRWRLVGWALDRGLSPLRNRLYPLPAPDQVLRTLVVRTAIRYGIALPELDRMEARLIESLRRNKP